MRIAVYVSGHGFGHASRAIEVANAIGRMRRDVSIVLRTEVSPVFIRSTAETPLTLQRTETDTGVAQIDSLDIDEAATVQRAATFYGDFDRRVATEAAALVEMGASIVVGDIPPLAFAAAARAGLRSVAVGNFTWDWIYAGYPSFAAIAPDVLPAVRHAYTAATVALRLPLHGGFAPMRRVTEDIPFIARRSHIGREQTRRLLGLADTAMVVLASFGAYGVGLPYPEIAAANPFTLIVTGDGPASDNRGGRLLQLSSDRLAGCGLRYQDLVAAADVVISKPGYGIVSECIANGAALLYTARGRFAEQEVFVRDMPHLLRCREIAGDDFRAGRWAEAVTALLRQPGPGTHIATNGAEIAAERILAEAGA